MARARRSPRTAVRSGFPCCGDSSASHAELRPSPPNHALQRMTPGRSRCNRMSSAASSLSLVLTAPSKSLTSDAHASRLVPFVNRLFPAQRFDIGTLIRQSHTITHASSVGRALRHLEKLPPHHFLALCQNQPHFLSRSHRLEGLRRTLPSRFSWLAGRVQLDRLTP